MIEYPDEPIFLWELYHNEGIGVIEQTSAFMHQLCFEESLTDVIEIEQITLVSLADVDLRIEKFGEPAVLDPITIYLP